jgi:hypothetical protein
MAGRVSIGQISESDFSNLLRALSATTKGRAFLAEYARRERPGETESLFESLQRIEATIATIRDQLEPDRIANELQRIAMTLEIAIDGVSRDPEGSEVERRFALVERVREEVVALAKGLGGEAEPAGAGVSERAASAAIELIEDEEAFLNQLGLGRPR